jgi:hypothetical protein
MAKNDAGGFDYLSVVDLDTDRISSVIGTEQSRRLTVTL